MNKEKYKGMIMKQSVGTMKVFDEFFEKESFNTVIEIGTVPGVFALYLSEKSMEYGFKFITLDIRKPNINILNMIKENGGHFFLADVFETKLIYNELLKSNRVLILNDGGLKEPVFRLYVPLLKVNDFILSHDYERDTLSCPNSGGISLFNIKDVIVKYNIKVVYEELFDKIYWLCCRRR